MVETFLTPNHSALSELELRAANPKEFRTWKSMKKRCSRKTSKYYGARGIAVCERWRESFRAFLEDVGPAPSETHSLDRFPDQNGHYEPGNVRWATPTEQARNRRDNPTLTVDGVTRTVVEWSEISGVPISTIIKRQHTGRSPEECLSIQQGPGNAVFLEHDGERRSLSEWSRRTGIPVGTIAWRRRQGWTPEECLRPIKRFHRSRRTLLKAGVA